MKSALERAMERFGGDDHPIRQLSREQKEQLAEIDRVYQAKIAHARITASEKSKYLQDPAEIEQLQQDTTLEVQTYTARQNREKDRLRSLFAKQATDSEN